MSKRAAAINDLSGLGRCSLTMSLPILSVLGTQCCPVPTAVLSSQTDGYRHYTFQDLTDTMPDYIGHWKYNGEQFDAIFTGFLGSSRQIDLVEDFIDSFRREETLVLVDPVMGDHGELYDSIDEEHCEGIRRLVSRADIITPNLTEAAILLKKGYLASEEAELLEWARRLQDLGPKTVVITGIDSGDDRLCVVCCDDQYAGSIHTPKVHRDYPGSGDMFASLLLGLLLRGDSLDASVRRAAEFISTCAAYTYELNTPTREGLVFEPLLGQLIK